MNFIPSLGTNLLASMSGESPIATSTSDQDRLLEPSIFTKDERRYQKEWLRKVCCSFSSRVPVCTDFFFERVRSRIAYVCISIQIYFYLVLEWDIVLSPLGFDPLPDCAQTLVEIDYYDDSYNIPKKLINDILSFYDISRNFMPVYLFLSSIALNSWNSPAWTILGAIIAIVNLAYISISNGQFCTEVNELIPRLGNDPSGLPFFASGYPLRVIYFYNVLKIAFTSIVTLTLIILAISSINKKIRGKKKLFVQEESGYKQPVINRKQNSSNLKPAFSVDFVLSFTRDFFENRLQVAPLRHVVACVLTTTVIFAMSSVFALITDVFRAFNTALWDYCKSQIDLDPFEPPVPIDDPDFINYLYEWISSTDPLILLAICFQNFGDHFFNLVFGSINDILAFAPFLIWVVALSLLVSILYSFYPISNQHEVLTKRYEGLQMQKRYRRHKESAKTQKDDNEDDSNLFSTYPADPMYHLAPDLRKVGYFSSFQYVVSHLLVHVSVFFFTCILLALLILGLTIACGSFQNILPVLAAAFYAQIFTIIRMIVPFFGDYVILPSLRLSKVDPATLFAPFRSMYISIVGIFAYSDGPYVFSPRIMMFVDTLWSLTIGIAIGIADAFSRLILSLISGLFRTVVMSEPVTFASIDRPYIAYCSMMKGAHIELFDIEELGQEFPPIEKAGAYEGTAVERSSEEVVNQAERKPLVPKKTNQKAGEVVNKI